MTLTLAHLTRARPRDLAVEVEGDTVNLSYDASEVTPAWADEFQGARGAAEMGDLLERVIKGWDVTDAACEASVLAALPVIVLNRFFTGIVDDAGVSRVEGNGSSAPSVTPQSASAEPQQSAPNGTTSSEPPVTSASPRGI